MQKAKLDDLKIFQKLDKQNVAGSLELLPGQIRQVLDESRLIKVPKEYSKVSNVVVAGMGGSSLGAYIARSVFAGELKAPIVILSGYNVPAFVGPGTLFILSSYSGTTEETLSVYEEAKARGAKLAAISADMPGNKLKALMLENDIPGYLFKPDANPSGQPRMAVGYAVFGLSVILAKAGLFKINVREVEDAIASMEIWSKQLSLSSRTAKNPAKKIASAVFGRAPILLGAEHLAGNLHALRNQINENAKLFSAYLELPDLNHHAMEGLRNPKENKKFLHFIGFESSLYHPRVQKRFNLTGQVIRKNGCKIISHRLSGNNRFAQALELLQFGSWLSYYLGTLYQVDPIKIPWVDWFKKELK